MTTLATQAQIQSATTSLAVAKATLGPGSPSNPVGTLLDQALGCLNTALQRWSPLAQSAQNAVTALTTDAAAFTMATLPTPAAAVAAAATALSTAIAATYPLQGEVVAAQAALAKAAASLSSGAALTVINAAITALTGLVS